VNQPNYWLTGPAIGNAILASLGPSECNILWLLQYGCDF